MFRRGELEIEARNFFPSQTRVTISLFERERAHTVGTMVFGPFCNGHTSNAACLNTVPVNNDGWNFSLFLKSYGSSATLGGFHRVVEHDPREESYRSDGRATRRRTDNDHSDLEKKGTFVRDVSARGIPSYFLTREDQAAFFPV